MNSKTRLLCLGFLLFLGTALRAQEHAPGPAKPTDPAAVLLAQVNAVLDRWDNGDPMGFIDVSAEDVTYFGPEKPRRTDGRERFRQLLAPIVGQIHNPPRRMVERMVRIHGDIALLTFVAVYDQLSSRGEWNVTEVYRREGADWKLIHSHWAEAKGQRVPTPGDPEDQPAKVKEHP